jgi:hypothetical protein
MDGMMSVKKWARACRKALADSSVHDKKNNSLKYGKILNFAK